MQVQVKINGANLISAGDVRCKHLIRRVSDNKLFIKTSSGQEWGCRADHKVACECFCLDDLLVHHIPFSTQVEVLDGKITVEY